MRRAVEADGPWIECWFDDSPRGETYGVRRESEVLCYTSRTQRGWEDAAHIAYAMNEVFASWSCASDAYRPSATRDEAGQDAPTSGLTSPEGGR